MNDIKTKMDFVVDANILISALISIEGKTCDLLFDDKLKLYSPEFLITEIEKHKDEILGKADISESELNLFLLLVFSRINLIPYDEFKECAEEARRISPDINDTEYFALALKFNCPIWSNDKKLKEQNKIIAYSTQEVINLLS
ncbi:MAG: PIN domain-containing protein [Candidatus Pacearchaeota archaeon]